MKAVVVLSGDLEAGPRIRAALDESALIIAADGGAEHLRKLDITPHVLIGDMDSISPALLRALEGGATEVLRFPERKDQTDAELALLEATGRGAIEITVLGALGGRRIDHELANVLLPAHPNLMGGAVRLLSESAEIWVVRDGERSLNVAKGDLISLIPITETVRGVDAEGLEWPLAGAVLRLGSSLGVSNVATAERIRVAVENGSLLLVHQFATAPD